MKQARYLTIKAIATCVIGISVSAFPTQTASAAQPGDERALDAALTTDDSADESDKSSGDTNVGASPSFNVQSVRGRVVWYGKALDRLLGIKTTSDAEHNTLAIETDDGRLLPLIDDLRARAFRKDERLRLMQTELLVRRYADTPSLQVLKMFEVEGRNKYQLDYWCDICAIVMFERGACACCQDDNRLRKRLVETP